MIGANIIAFQGVSSGLTSAPFPSHYGSTGLTGDLLNNSCLLNLRSIVQLDLQVLLLYVLASYLRRNRSDDAAYGRGRTDSP
jgi:hypothetical protein